MSDTNRPTMGFAIISLDEFHDFYCELGHAIKELYPVRKLENAITDVMVEKITAYSGKMTPIDDNAIKALNL